MKIRCRTTFDCTYTGITGHSKGREMPFLDRAQQTVQNLTDWNRSRNQQRNYETLLQIFGLRTQPLDITEPQQLNGVWEFTFETETEGVFYVHGQSDILAGLKIDCDGVPMMLGLTELNDTGPVLIAQGPDQNIWFDVINN